MTNDVAYCGLYCPKCYKNSVSSAAKNLKRVVLRAKNVCGKKYLTSQEIKKELNNLIALRCANFCRAGGGKSDCKIKICCLDKTLDGCWQCEGFIKCDLLNNRFKKNILKIKEQGVEKFVQEYEL